MVYLGDLCRSPSAEGVLRAALARHGLDELIEVDSCGTSDIGMSVSARIHVPSRMRLSVGTTSVACAPASCACRTLMTSETDPGDG